MLWSHTCGSLRWDRVPRSKGRDDVCKEVARVNGPEGWTHGESLFQIWMATLLLGLIGLVIGGMGVLVDAWESFAMNVVVPIILTAIVLAGASRAVTLHPRREDLHMTVRATLEETTDMLTAFMRAEGVDWDTHRTAWSNVGLGRLRQRTTFKHDGTAMSILMRSRVRRPLTKVTVEDYDEDMERFVERLGRALRPLRGQIISHH